MWHGKDATPELEMSIPGLDWGMEEVMLKDMKKVPQKKVPYAKPIPAQFQQVRNSKDPRSPRLAWKEEGRKVLHITGHSMCFVS